AAARGRADRRRLVRPRLSRAARHQHARSAAGGRADPSPAAQRRGRIVKRLWAPWRTPYLKEPARPTGCLFCRVWKSKTDRTELVLARGEHALLMLNRFPYNAGHLMVACGRHVARFEGMREEERADLVELVVVAERALRAVYRPHGL